MVSAVRRAAPKKLSRAWRACVRLRSAMVRISSGTWKFIGLVPWSPSAMVYPPCRCGPESRSQPIRAGQQPQKKERTIPRKGQPMFGARGRPSVEKSNEPWATFVSAQLLSTRHMRVCCNGLAPRLTWTSCPQEAAMDEDPGSFGSRLFEDGERFVAMFGEVLLALDGTVPRRRWMVRAAFRKAARVWGALPDRVRQASSRQVRSRTWGRRFSMPQCPRAMLSHEAASARSRDRLVMACTPSMLSLPRKLRRRSMRQTWRRPGHWLREEARLSLHSRRRISMRPCPFSTGSTRATSGAGAHAAEGGIRPEGQGDVGFQRRLVALDREEVIAAALDDEATEVGLGEDRIAADDRTLDGKRLEQSQSRRDLVGLRRHPQLPDDTLQPFAERGQQMHSGRIADGAAPQPLAVNRHMSGCAHALHPSPEEPFQRAHIQRPEKLAPHRRRRHATAQNSKFRQGLPA